MEGFRGTAEEIGLYAGNLTLALLGMNADTLERGEKQPSTNPTPSHDAEAYLDIPPSTIPEAQEYLQRLALRDEVKLRPGNLKLVA
jgi:hypothetical protein